MIPAAVQTESMRGMLLLEQNTPDSPLLHRRFIINRRGRSEEWQADTESLAATTPDRNAAHIYASFAEVDTSVREGASLSLLEFIPLEESAPLPLQTRVIPAAVEERSYNSMRDEWRERHTIEDCRPLIIRTAPGLWRSGAAGDNSVTGERNMAHVYTYYGDTDGQDITGQEVAEILPQGTRLGGLEPRPVLTPKTSLVQQKFQAEFIKMFKAAPKNEFIKGWILKVTKQLPPEEVDDIEKLEAWLQSIQPKPGEPVPAPTVKEPLRITLNFTGKKSGQCDYEVSTTGSDEFEFDEDELRELVSIHFNFSGALQAVKENMEECAYENTDPGMEAVDEDYSYSNYELSDGNSDDFTYDIGLLKCRLKEWIRDNMPDKASEMGI